MTGKLRNVVRTLAVGGLIAVGTFVLPSPANAGIGTCGEEYPNPKTYEAWCSVTGTSSHYRAVATCYKLGPGPSYVAKGQWRYISQPSSKATCLTGYEAGSGWIEKVSS